MNDISRRGVYNNLNISPFIYKVGKFEFVFSSRGNYNKFVKKVDDYKAQTKSYLEKKIGLNIEVEAMIEFMLYERTETRGFLIRKDGVNLCRNLKLNGELENKNS